VTTVTRYRFLWDIKCRSWVLKVEASEIDVVVRCLIVSQHDGVRIAAVLLFYLLLEYEFRLVGCSLNNWQRPCWKIENFNDVLTVLHSYDVIKIFEIAAVDVASQLPVPVWLCICPQKARMSNCTKFHKDTSFHGWVITTSHFRKRTAAILKYYFRFQF